MPKAPVSLRDRALAYLARREHSRFELECKLEQAGYPSSEIAQMLDEFERKNWLSDRRFAESYVADHKAKYGAIKLTYELRQRGVAESIIESVLAQNGDSELLRAKTIWQKNLAVHLQTKRIRRGNFGSCKTAASSRF